MRQSLAETATRVSRAKTTRASNFGVYNRKGVKETGHTITGQEGVVNKREHFDGFR